MVTDLNEYLYSIHLQDDANTGLSTHAVNHQHNAYMGTSTHSTHCLRGRVEGKDYVSDPDNPQLSSIYKEAVAGWLCGLSLYSTMRILGSSVLSSGL